MSGVFAAKAIKKAKDSHDYSKASLSYYQQLMQDSFVLKDMDTFRKAPNFLENQRLFTVYPQVLCETLEKMMNISAEPKQKLSATAMREIRNKLGWSVLKELRGVFKI